MFRSRQCILVRIFNVDDFGSVIIPCERLAGTVGIIERIAGLPTDNGEKIRFRVFCQVWYNQNEPYVGHGFRAILDGQLVHQ